MPAPQYNCGRSFIFILVHRTSKRLNKGKFSRTRRRKWTHPYLDGCVFTIFTVLLVSSLNYIRALGVVLAQKKHQQNRFSSGKSLASTPVPEKTMEKLTLSSLRNETRRLRSM
jgi:hypothetical protein